MKLAVMGTGHVGLITCVTFSTLGHEVIGTDIDEGKIDLLRAGKPPFFEEGLEPVLHEELASGRLSFTTDPEEALGQAEVIFIAVGPPPAPMAKRTCWRWKARRARSGATPANGVVVVEKSTVPAGTAERLRVTLARESQGLRFSVASNPEFLREGTALVDSLEPDRIVIGVESDWARDVLRRVYAPLTAKGHRLIETDIATAELAKHASNAFLAMKISYVNAIARICERAGADVASVAEVMGSIPGSGVPS